MVARKSPWKTFMKNKELLLLTLPALAYFFVFHYMPMGGIWMAFTNYRHVDGIFGSEFVGLQWFRIFFQGDLTRVTRNTVGYAGTFIILGVVTGVFTAVLMNAVRSKIATKTYQTIMILPHFMSWIVVSLILYIFLDPQFGVINRTLISFGIDPIWWYSTPEYWPFILTFMNIWKSVGMGSIIYYAALMGIDPSLYESASMDGAGKIAKFRFITLPSLVPLITILTLLALGGLFRGDFGLFFAVPRDVGALYPTTDILDTYIFRGLRQGLLSLNAAAGLFQSVMGFIAVVSVNMIVKKISPENSLF
ncbi:MAG: ABC transporter permease subunit [Defluviitaleaceae bacterium]|nr:ABC transporter permease subunit [Defluviitaleaceae bacterium]